MSAIAPMNYKGTVVGAIAAYRQTPTKFTEEEFRRLELLASQTAIALSNVSTQESDPSVLFDQTTGLPNTFQLHLMFERLSTDALRYEYPLALLAIHFEDHSGLRRRFGRLTAQEALKATANCLRDQLRETDLLVRYGPHEFLALSPGTTRDQAEALKSRLQDVLDRFQWRVNADTTVPLPVSIGISMFPEDATSLNAATAIAESSLAEDKELRVAVRNRVRSILRD
jgi:diguanylate cyclase (GGDEF)-like protein